MELFFVDFFVDFSDAIERQQREIQIENGDIVGVERFVIFFMLFGAIASGFSCSQSVGS